MATTWTAPVFNFAGISLFEDELDVVPSDYYKVQVVETEPWKKKGGTEVTSIHFKLRVVEGIETSDQNKGKTLSTFPGLAVNEGNTRNWKAAYLSRGAKAETMEGSFAPDPGHFPAGTIMYVKHDMPLLAEGEKVKTEDISTKFIRPELYLERKAARGSSAGKGAPAFAVTQTPAAPAGNGAAPATPQPPTAGQPASLFSGAPPTPPTAPAQPNSAPTGGPAFG